jgi:hypothetical protein
MFLDRPGGGVARYGFLELPGNRNIPPIPIMSELKL